MSGPTRRLVPYGALRAAWRSRQSLPRVAQPLSRAVDAEPPRNPIFVIGCPRSGTTMLLDALLASPELASVDKEGHVLWRAHHHPRRSGWDSDALGAADVSERERRYVNLAIRMFARASRFVDKTPENCLRVPYLRELFGDASFVFLCRRAGANVGSLMEGWRAWPRYVAYRLPVPLTGLGERSGRDWSFALIPGWRELTAAPLEEICARQYVACNEAALAARADAAPGRWHDVTYEDLVADPVATLAGLYSGLGLSFSGAPERHARELPARPAATALSPPREGKWRELDGPAIERVAELFEPTERRLGYGAGSSPQSPSPPVNSTNES